MRLTLKELQTTMQEQIDVMKTQLQKSKREEYELHERADTHLLNLDAFRKEADCNFREVRTEIAEVRTEVADLRTELAGLRAEMRAELAAFRAEMRAGFASIMSYATHIDVNHEARIAALEANNPR